MYCQKLIINTLKHFRIVTRSSYVFASICSLNQRKNKFMTYLQQINKIKNNYNTNKRKNLSQTGNYIISGSFLFDLFFPKEEKNDVEELIMTIKRSILLIQVRLILLYYHN